MKDINISPRLLAVAGLVDKGAVPCDVGTDHGYVPIWLIRQGICPHALAMDINPGPLKKAEENIKACCLSDKIQIRLSDGLRELRAGEADTMIAAGMGGNLIIRILEDSPDIVSSLSCLILQPQSDIDRVRGFLNREGFRIVDEDMVISDGKYYMMMKAVKGSEPALTPEELLYGRQLLNGKHPVLEQFLNREYKIRQNLIETLSGQEGERALKRKKELLLECSRIDRIREIYYKKTCNLEK